MKDIGKKLLHGLMVGAGAALAVVVAPGAASVGLVVKAALGAFGAYLLKPARPAAPDKGDGG